MYKKTIVLLFVVAITNYGFTQPNFNVWLAGKTIDKGNTIQAKKLYLKALSKNKDNYEANLGLGLLLSECNSDYQNALPYLEKAIKETKKDTVADLIYAIAKCYQFATKFEKALLFFNKLDKVKSLEDDNKEFKKDVYKRKLDCQYALKNYDNTKTNVGNTNLVINVGNQINTDAPEYVPVLNTKNELIFTSKRKDDKNEKINSLNSSYFESMYISKCTNGKFEAVKHYTLTDAFLKTHHKNSNESIVSISGDEKKIYIYRDAQIYETNIEDLKKVEPKALSQTINFDYYQSHAFLSKDGNTLYFTSESKTGFGGNDIYKSTKIKDGEWSAPENLGNTINTDYDEDAPFISDDGLTLYFASKGHIGFGNYDVFKSTFLNGKWGTAINLEQPINSTGNDIFFTQTNNQQVGYFSSSRAGGFGDMDIYKINYVEALNRTCSTTPNDLTQLNLSDTDPNDFKNTLAITTQKNYKAHSFEWFINDKSVGNNKNTLSYDYLTAGVYKVLVKTVLYCDSCLDIIMACNSIENKFISKKIDTLITPLVDLKTTKGELNKEQLKTIGFNLQPVYFDLKQNTITADAEKILQGNIVILKQNPTLCVQLIVGYNKNDTKANANLKLSKARAESVKKYLLKNKVNSKQILKLISKSESDGVITIPTNTEQPYRRVIFKVINN